MQDILEKCVRELGGVQIGKPTQTRSDSERIPVNLALVVESEYGRNHQ